MSMFSKKTIVGATVLYSVDYEVGALKMEAEVNVTKYKNKIMALQKELGVVPLSMDLCNQKKLQDKLDELRLEFINAKLQDDWNMGAALRKYQQFLPEGEVEVEENLNFNKSWVIEKIIFLQGLESKDAKKKRRKQLESEEMEMKDLELLLWEKEAEKIVEDRKERYIRDPDGEPLELLDWAETKKELEKKLREAFPKWQNQDEFIHEIPKWNAILTFKRELLPEPMTKKYEGWLKHNYLPVNERASQRYYRDHPSNKQNKDLTDHKVRIVRAKSLS